LQIDVLKEHFPYWSKNLLGSVKDIRLYDIDGTAKVTEKQAHVQYYIDEDGHEKSELVNISPFALKEGFTRLHLDYKLEFPGNETDVLVVLKWGK
jgi:hypothetical protein